MSKKEFHHYKKPCCKGSCKQKPPKNPKRKAQKSSPKKLENKFLKNLKIFLKTFKKAH
jgi:hypothetical protein